MRWNDNIVENSEYLFQIDLGPCASVVLCGKDESGTVWIGVNHLFKAREENVDMSLKHVSELRYKLLEKKVDSIRCLGVFGAGYQENSLAKNVARKNVMTIIEALDIFEFDIEIFETGYSQALAILKSDKLESFIIRVQNLNTKEVAFFEVPLKKLFK